jgi:hypothetical protein
VLVLLVVMVSSVVRADGNPVDVEPARKASGAVSVMSSDMNIPVGTVRVMDGDPIDPTPKASGAVGSDPIIIYSPTDPDAKATPILW